MILLTYLHSCMLIYVHAYIHIDMYVCTQIEFKGLGFNDFLISYEVIFNFAGLCYSLRGIG